MKIIGFAGSNSKNSINFKLVHYTAGLLDTHEVELLDLNDYEVSIYSIDREKEQGFPNKIKDFVSKIKSADALVISLAEHNGAYSATFKNIIDWSSRYNIEFFDEKPMLLMGTSPGGYGAKNVIGLAESRFPKFKANIKAVFSLPKFNDNFEEGEGVTDEKLKKEHQEALRKFIDSE